MKVSDTENWRLEGIDRRSRDNSIACTIKE